MHGSFGWPGSRTGLKGSVDRRVLHLIKIWLECPVEQTDDRGRKTRTTEARDNRRGIPQGSPISPLMANIYMRRLVLGWKKLGLERSLGSRIVTYADDLVILCRKGNADEALQQLHKIMSKLKLTVNEEKTRICKVPEGEFDFLGYTFGRMHSARTGQARHHCPARGCASFARCCPTSWPSARTFSHHGWYASSLILPVTGGSSMSELNR